MTHDKVRQDFDGLTHQTVKELLKLRYNETDEDAIKTFTWAVKQAERAEIREKLESEGAVADMCISYNGVLLAQPEDCRDQPKAMKAAITKILEVI